MMEITHFFCLLFTMRNLKAIISTTKIAGRIYEPNFYTCCHRLSVSQKTVLVE